MMANNRRRLIGKVVSDKMQKTVIVEIERRKMHPVYRKVIKFTKRVMAHDESDTVPMGALVRIVESRPLSRHKRWAVEEVLQAEGHGGTPAIRTVIVQPAPEVEPIQVVPIVPAELVAEPSQDAPEAMIESPVQTALVDDAAPVPSAPANEEG
ncbi:MAG: 30S ribosomal protein S17 [Armatimonadetes bacterium]|nr:30S ribosomal protein S17 [Anaerolineae bacterium]